MPYVCIYLERLFLERMGIGRHGELYDDYDTTLLSMGRQHAALLDKQKSI